MILLPRRTLLAVAAVVDVALHARPAPVSAKALAGRLGLPPRHLEPALQALVRCGILKGVRGPRGGYELARERRRISVGDVVRAAREPAGGVDEEPEDGSVRRLVGAALAEAGAFYLARLDTVMLEELCRQAQIPGRDLDGDFAI